MEPGGELPAGKRRHAVSGLPEAVQVEAPARLHFGMLDLRGDLGRRFGGLGAALPAPRLRLRATRSERLHASGLEIERVRGFAERFLTHHGLRGGAHLHLFEAMPAHAGLGSGTQLGLSVARALAELNGLPTDPLALAAAVGRGARSGVGVWAFAYGGFVLEGGRRDIGSIAPLLARHPMPETWQCVLLIPESGTGLSGENEAAAFRSLPQPPAHEIEHVAHLVLMQLLPAVVEADLPAFGAALSDIQRVNGDWFAASQGGRYAPGPTAMLVGLLRDAGALGVGQSSWGPTVYGIAPDLKRAQDLAQVARGALSGASEVIVTPFDNGGVRVTPMPHISLAD